MLKLMALVLAGAAALCGSASEAAVRYKLDIFSDGHIEDGYIHTGSVTYVRNSFITEDTVPFGSSLDCQVVRSDGYKPVCDYLYVEFEIHRYPVYVNYAVYYVISPFSSVGPDNYFWPEDLAKPGVYDSMRNAPGYSSRLTVSVVPEPASWAMMIGGFALVGAGLRQRRMAARFA